MFNVIRAYTHFQEIVQILYRYGICVQIGILILFCKNFSEKQQSYSKLVSIRLAKRQKLFKRRKKCWM